MNQVLFEELSAFLDDCFEYSEPADSLGLQNSSYSLDFAPLFQLDEPFWEIKRDEQGRISATGALGIVNLRTYSGLEIKMGLVGAIATAKDSRGRGLAKTVLANLETKAIASGCQSMALWSQGADFYAKLGFHAWGTQSLLYLAPKSNATNESLAAGMKALEITPNDPLHLNALSKLHKKYLKAGVLRTDEQWNGIAKITSCHYYGVLNAQNELLAYIAHSRGKDMSGIVHEWAGEPALLESLILTFAPSPLTILSDPNHPPSFLNSFEVLHEEQFPLCLLKDLRKEAGPFIKGEDFWFWGLDSI